MSKLISQKYPTQYANQGVLFPNVGEIKFNEDGSLDVADSDVADLIEATKESFDFKIVVAQENEVVPTEGGSGDLDIDPLELEKWKELLKIAPRQELLEMAKAAKISKYQTLSDDILREKLLLEMAKETK